MKSAVTKTWMVKIYYYYFEWVEVNFIFTKDQFNYHDAIVY